MKIGMTYTSTLIVEEKHTAHAFGSGEIFVFSTPMMIGLMENAAMNCAQEDLTEELGTVGISVNIKHLAATPMGQEVKATATIEEVDGKRLVFKVEAFDEKQKIGEGVHERFVINKEKFLKKVEG